MKKVFVWREGVIRSLPLWTAAAIAALLFSGCAGLNSELKPTLSEYYEPIIMPSARSESAKITDADEATLTRQGYYMVGKLATRLLYSTDQDLLVNDFLHLASQHGGDLVRAAKVESFYDIHYSGGGEIWVNRLSTSDPMKDNRPGAWRERGEVKTTTLWGVSMTSTVWRYDPQRKDWTTLSDPEILVHAAQFGQIELVNFLLKKGMPTDTLHKSKIGPDADTTALYQAALNGHTTLVKILLEHGANANAGLFVPLRGAVKACDPNIVDLLIARGANGNWVEPYGNKESLLIFMQLNKCYDVSIMKMLVKAGAKVNYAEKDGVTALHCAVRLGEEKAVNALLELGADKNMKKRNGFTACDMATGSESREIRQLLQCK